MTTAVDLRGAAEQTFTELSQAYSTGDAPYWQLGHFFDTALDYFTVVSAASAAQFGKDACANFDAKTSGDQWPSYWYDDHGWWGIAALRASGHPDWFGSLVPKFQAIATRCWTTMDTMAPTVWDRRPRPGGTDPFAALQPLFPGGVWNFEWTTDGSCDPTSSDALCGIQNTVTNALYLIQAARRFEAYGDPTCRAAAGREYGFLDQWFHVAAPIDPLLNRSASGSAIVRERVSSYRRGGRAAGYVPDRAWSGDQGLIVGALLDSAPIVGDDSTLVALAQAILAGTLEQFGGGGVLAPWIPPSSGWTDDYLTGPAAFFRYVLHAYATNATLRAWMSDESSGYPAFIDANAEHAASQPPGGDMIDLTNALAALVVGIAFLT
jgi:hypothetical protein